MAYSEHSAGICTRWPNALVAPSGAIKREDFDAITKREDQRGLRTTDDEAGSNLRAAFLRERRSGALRRRHDREDRAHRHIGFDIRRPIERVIGNVEQPAAVGYPPSRLPRRPALPTDTDFSAARTISSARTSRSFCTSPSAFCAPCASPVTPASAPQPIRSEISMEALAKASTAAATASRSGSCPA